MSNVHPSYISDSSFPKKVIKDVKAFFTNKYIVLSEQLVYLFKQNGCDKIVNGSILVEDVINFLSDLARYRPRLYPIYHLLSWAHYTMGFDYDNTQYLEILNLLRCDNQSLQIYYHETFEISYVKTISITNLLKCISKKDGKLAKDYVMKIACGRISSNELFDLYYLTLKDYANTCKNYELLRTVDALNRVHIKFNSAYALENMQKLAYLLFTVGINFAKTPCLANFDHMLNQVNLDNTYADTTTLHELGHCFNHNFNVMPQNFVEVLDRAKRRAFAYPGLLSFLNRVQNNNDYINSAADSQALDYINATYGSVSNLKSSIFNFLKEILENNSVKVATEKLFKTYDLDIKTIQNVCKMLNTQWCDLVQLTETIYSSIFKSYSSFYALNNLHLSFSDIVTNVFEKSDFNIWNQSFCLSGHDNDYYSSHPKGLFAYFELMANYNVLMLYNRFDMIYELRQIFGDELFDLLGAVYQEQNDYRNVPGIVGRYNL